MASSSKSNSATQQSLSEVSQAKIRIAMHVVFVVLTLAAYRFDPNISIAAVGTISIASFVAAFGLYSWAKYLQSTDARPRQRFALRSACLFSDNLFVTLVLAIGGASTAGLWTIYLWTSIGYGVRYGIPYLNASVVVSSIGFLAMTFTSSFWGHNPAFVVGMLMGMIIVPVYTGYLIRQLHSAVQEREEAYRAKSSFVARMSHELRTPLHAIISTAELLRNQLTSAIHNDYVNVISLSSNTLLDLINRVLDLNKFESGDVGLSKGPVNVHGLLADAVNLIYGQATARNIVVKLFTDPRIPADLIGAKTHINEILLNILGNAVKFTDSGSIEISADLESLTATSANVNFTVVDTGCGIPERDLGRIFEPFVQSDQSTTRKHGGTGLGTSFSREIVRLMGGNISIESTISLGTTVRFNIPLDRQEVTSDSGRQLPIRFAMLGSQSGLAYIRSCVSGFGATVELYEDLEDLPVLAATSPDNLRFDGLIIESDMFGHNLPGIQMKLSAKHSSRLFPVVGFGAAELRTVAISSGYCSYISRSSSPGELASTLAVVTSLVLMGNLGSAQSDRPRASRTLSVLVADDNATNQMIARVALEGAGHQCTLVGNGDDALFALNDVQFDVALLDMHMPGRTGVEVAKLYRFAGFANETPTPIVLLTADCTSDARDEAASAGISVFLTKPILPSELVRVVEEASEKFANASRPAVGPTIRLADRVVMFPIFETGTRPDSADSPLLNEVAVAELVALMTKNEQRVFFAEFCDDATSYVAKLSTLSGLAGVADVKESMHALAGAASTIGATRLSRSASQIERADGSVILQKKYEYLDELTKIFDATKEEISLRYIS